MITVHLADKPEPPYLAILTELLDPAINLRFGNVISSPETITYLVSGRPTVEMISACIHLKGLIIPFAGIPEVTQKLMRDYPHIPIHNLHHNAVPTAENALALLLSAAKNIIPAHNALRANDWRPRYAANPAILLSGKTALILGYGQIGSKIAKYLSALDMNILAMRNSIDEEKHDGIEVIYPSRFLHTLLPKADVLINTLPLTDATNDLIGEQEFALLPQGAIVVNVGRGKVLNAGAFYNALKNGHLSAAAIDVWYRYPENEESRAHTEPADFPFGELENVVMSPHRAGGLNTEATERLRVEHLAELLNYAAREEELPNRVDLSRGY